MHDFSRKARAHYRDWSCHIARGGQNHAIYCVFDQTISPGLTKADNDTTSSGTETIHMASMIALLGTQVACWLIIKRYRLQEDRSIGLRGSSNFMALDGCEHKQADTITNQLTEMVNSHFPCINAIWQPILAYGDFVRDPAPITFLTACIIFAVVTALFQQLRQQDRFQKRFLLLGVLTVVLSSFLQNETRLQKYLQCFLPGVIIMILPSSILVHWLGRRLGYAI